MTHRRPDPRQRDLEDVLRRALITAAESIEPAADGLDRIRTKISARLQRRQLRWSMAHADRFGAVPLLLLLTAAARLRPMLDTVLASFRPNPGGSGRYGWLRPAGALAIVLLVIVAGSWAVTALPQVIAPSANSNAGPHSIGVGTPAANSSTSPGSHGGGVPGPGVSSQPSGTPSCKPRAAHIPPTSRPTATPSPTASASPSPSASPSGSPSPSSSPTGSPSPTASPVDTSSPQASPQSTANLAATARPTSPAGHQRPASPKPTHSAAPKPSVTPPCE